MASKYKGYEISIFSRVAHNGQFAHNNARHMTIRAINEEEAEAVAKKTLKPASEMWVGKDTDNPLHIEVSEESIYETRCLGRGRLVKYWEYGN